MDIRVGTQILEDVGIPVVWGDRAIVQHSERRLSVIDSRSQPARLEILKDQPAPGVNFVPTLSGFRILPFRGGAYEYNKTDKTLTSATNDLPECQIGEDYVRVGSGIVHKNPDHRTDASLLVTASDVRLVNRLPDMLAELIADDVPNPDIPEHSFILSGKTSTGESIKVARGICECNVDHDLSKEFFLNSGERWICPDCENIYSFDGERIAVTRPITGTPPPDGSILAIVSRHGDSWTRQNAQELDQVVLQSVRLLGSPHVFVWIANDFWETQAPYIRFNLGLSAPGVAWKVGPRGTTTDKSYVLYRADPTKEPVID
jgi:hypothetical protein